MKKILQITAIILLAMQATAQNKNILFVLSAADTLALNDGSRQRQTGVFLNEFYLAYKALSEAGYTIDIATPQGKVATIDKESLDEKYWKGTLALKQEAVSFCKTSPSFKHPMTLENALENRHQYIGLVIPGGQGLMVDLMQDPNIPILLADFAKSKKPTGLICHAPSLLLTIPASENPYLGFSATSVSPMEEFVIERFIMKGKPKRRKIARQLKKLGLHYKQGLPKANYAVRDRNLVTSQNPFSSESFNRLYLEALGQYLDEKNTQ